MGKRKKHEDPTEHFSDEAASISKIATEEKNVAHDKDENDDILDRTIVIF